MTDFAVTVFHLANDRGLIVPGGFQIIYIEKDTGSEWRIDFGGSRAYFVRFNHRQLERDLSEQAADSHFMARRLTSSLLLAGAGLFRADAVGRIMFDNVQGYVTWRCDIYGPPTPERLDQVGGWFRALATHTVLRRAADDAYYALSHPTETAFYVYRGFEWVHASLNVDWDEIAEMIGVSPREFKQFRQFANVETGVRHASRSGKKARPTVDDGTWVCALFDVVNATRARLEPDFAPTEPEAVAKAVALAMPRLFP